MGTAGHVDHGKTALIKALTGIDCDRLPAEKEREITIDIGFAHLKTGDGRFIGIVDVPGHERFVKNMLAGVSGIDFVLMVIAADDGVMPQTLEHLEICDLLHIRKGIVAITKTDLVDEEWVGVVADDVRKVVAGTFLEGAPVVPVSSVSKAGIKELAEEIIKLAKDTESRNEWGPVRLSIDRVFTMKGAGTVVTGTLVSGTLAVDQELTVLPEGRAVRVRQLQVHGFKRREAGAGQRVAVNLAGVELDEVARGDTLAEPGLDVSHVIDVKIRAVSRLPKPISNRTRIRLYLGTQEIIGRVKFFDCDELQAGEASYARLRLESPVVCTYKDLFILRDFSAVRTIGGGVVLDSKPSVMRRAKESIGADLKRKEQGGPEELVEQAVADSGFTPVAARDVSSRINLDPAETGRVFDELMQRGVIVGIPGAGKAVSRVAFERLKAMILARFGEYFDKSPKKVWVTQQEIKTKYFPKEDAKSYEHAVRTLVDSGALAVSLSGRGLRHTTGSERILEEEENLRRNIERVISEGGFNSPVPSELPPHAKSELLDSNEVFQTLVDAGVIIRLSPNAFLHRDTIEEAKRRTIEFIKEKGSMTISDVREIFGASRKFSVPLLEYFDSQKVTIRKGDVRELHPGMDGKQ